MWPNSAASDAMGHSANRPASTAIAEILRRGSAMFHSGLNALRRGAPHLPEAQGGAGNDLLELGDSEGDAQAQLEEMGMFPDAMPRQLMAIVSAGDRSEAVSRIKAPTLVLHGEDDNLLPKEHGQHTHEMIDGSSFIVYPGMGHNMPPEVVPQMLQAMAQHFPAAG